MSHRLGTFNGIYHAIVKAVEEDKNPPELISLEKALKRAKAE